MCASIKKDELKVSRGKSKCVWNATIDSVYQGVTEIILRHKIKVKRDNVIYHLMGYCCRY